MTWDGATDSKASLKTFFIQSSAQGAQDEEESSQQEVDGPILGMTSDIDEVQSLLTESFADDFFIKADDMIGD